MIFPLFDCQVEISEGLVKYNEIRKGIFLPLEKEVWDDFKERYYSQFSNMDQVISGILDFTGNYIRAAIEAGIMLLNSFGIHSYNSERIVSEFGEQISASILYYIESIEDEYLEILEDQQAAAAYRQQRKDSRGRWQGGGFGVGGAVKGAMTAGAANMASGAAHSLVNAVGNAGSSFVASRKKKKMFSEESGNWSKYRTGVIDGIEVVQDSIVYILKRETDELFEFPRKDSDSLSRYKAVIDNISKKYITVPDDIKTLRA